MKTDKKFPKALKKDPIIEATFEIRFKSAINGVADLLPGALYPLLKDQYQRVESLPASEIPKAIRDQLPNSAYQGSKRLVGKGTNLNIAEQAIAVGVLRPYWGWDKFKSLIFQVISAVDETDLVGEVERISLRYQNILIHAGPYRFSSVHVPSPFTG